jgi:predicted nucleic acid-binding Zn ribbon protein
LADNRLSDPYMTANTCPACNHPVPDGAETCDHCGKLIHYPEPVATRHSWRRTFWLWLVLTLVFLAVWWALGPKG